MRWSSWIYGGSCGVENRSALLKVLSLFAVEWLIVLLLIARRLLLYFNYCRFLFINYKICYHLKAVMLPIIRLPIRSIKNPKKHFFLNNFPFHLFTVFSSNWTNSSYFISYYWTMGFCFPLGYLFFLLFLLNICMPSWCSFWSWISYSWYISNCFCELNFCFSKIW